MNNIILNEVERTKILMGLNIKEKKVINEQLFPFLKQGIKDLTAKIVDVAASGGKKIYKIAGREVEAKIAKMFNDIFEGKRVFDDLSIEEQKDFLKNFYYWVKSNPEQTVKFTDDVYADIFRKFKETQPELSEFELLGSIRYNMRTKGEDVKTTLKNLFPNTDEETLDMLEFAFKKRLTEYDVAFKGNKKMRSLEGDNADIPQVKTQSGPGVLSKSEIDMLAKKLKNGGTIWKILWNTLRPIYKTELKTFRSQCDQAVLGYKKSIEDAIANVPADKIDDVVETINSAYIMKITELMKAMNARKAGEARKALDDLGETDPDLKALIQKSDSKQFRELQEIMDVELGYIKMLNDELIEIAKNTGDIIKSILQIFYKPKTVLQFLKRSDIQTFFLTNQWLTFRRMFYLASKYSLSESKAKAFLTYTIASIGITIMGQVSATVIGIVKDAIIEGFWNKILNKLIAGLGNAIDKDWSNPVDTFLSDKKKELESENKTSSITTDILEELLSRFGGDIFEYLKDDMVKEAALVSFWRLVPAGGLQSYDESIVSKVIEGAIGNERLEIKPLPFDLAGIFGWDLKTVEQGNKIIDKGNEESAKANAEAQKTSAAAATAKEKLIKKIDNKKNEIITNIGVELTSSTNQTITRSQKEILKKNIKYTGLLDKEFDESKFIIKLNGKDYKYSWGVSDGPLFDGKPINPQGKTSEIIPLLFGIKEHIELNQIINKIKRIVLQEEEEEKTLKMKDWDEIFTFQKIDDKNPGKYTDVKIKMDSVMDRMPHWRKKYNKQCEELENCDDDGEDDSFVRAVIDTHPDVVRILYTKGLANLTSSDDQEDLNEGFHSLLRVIREAKNVEVEVWSVYRHPSSPDKIWSLVKGDYKPKELSSMDMKMQQSPQNKIEKKKDSLDELKKKELDAIKTLSLDEKKGLQELPIRVRDKVKEKIKRGWTTEKPSEDLIDFFKLDNVDSVFDEKIKIYKLKPNTDFFNHLDKKTFDVNIKRGFCRALYYVEKELDLSKEKLFKVEEILSKCENKFDGKYGQNYL